MEDLDDELVNTLAKQHASRRLGAHARMFLTVVSTDRNETSGTWSVT